MPPTQESLADALVVSDASMTASATAGPSTGAPGPSRAKIWGYQGDSAYVRGLAWSPDGRWIASCGTKPIVLFASNGGVRIWDAATGRRVLTEESPPHAMGVGPCREAGFPRFSPLL